MIFRAIRTYSPPIIPPTRATAWARVRTLALTDPRAAVQLAHTLAPVAARAMADRLESDSRYD